MRTPGFTADRSLSCGGRVYQMVGSPERAHDAVQPAQSDTISLENPYGLIYATPQKCICVRWGRPIYDPIRGSVGNRVCLWRICNWV